MWKTTELHQTKLMRRLQKYALGWEMLTGIKKFVRVAIHMLVSADSQVGWTGGLGTSRSLTWNFHRGPHKLYLFAMIVFHVILSHSPDNACDQMHSNKNSKCNGYICTWQAT